MTAHRFGEQLSFSHGAGDEPEWCAAYREVWPDLAQMIDMRHPGEHQKQGIDRVVILANGNVMTIDEKVRREAWPDLLVEIWSVYENRVPGWTIDPHKKCSHIAYLFLPTRTCILVPFDELRRATISNRAEWEAKAGPMLSGRPHPRGTEGFRWVVAPNERDNGSHFETWSIAVPRTVIQRAILAAMVVHWPRPLSANRGDGST